MKQRLKILSVYVIRAVLHIVKIIPVCNRRILFCSHKGLQYSCNPRAISEELAKRNEAYHIIWSFIKASDFPDLCCHGYTLVKHHSFRYWFFYITAKIIVDNHGFPAYVPVKKKQILINTWHGGGVYKKVGIDAENDFFTRKTLELTGKRISWYISSSQKFSECMSRAFFISPDKMLPFGSPRNDQIFQNANEELRCKIKERYGIPLEMQLALYAPTYRGSFDNPDDLIIAAPLDTVRCRSTLETKFGGKFALLFRAHYSVLSLGLVSDPNVVTVSDYPDMQELLCAADVLITDYSTSMWDYSFTGRPCFLYVPDLSLYEAQRGFYVPPGQWPFPLCRSNEELFEKILTFDAEQQAKKNKKHHDDLGSFEKGYASSLVCDLIAGLCNN